MITISIGLKGRSRLADAELDSPSNCVLFAVAFFPRSCSLTLSTTGVVRRVRQLRQSRVGAGCYPGHERLPDRDEAAEGSAEAVQERQQTLLILAPGPPPLPSSNASTARVSSPSSQGHHSKDSVGQRGLGRGGRGRWQTPSKTPERGKKKKLVAMTFYTFTVLHSCVLVFCFSFCHVTWVRLFLMYVIIYDCDWSQCFAGGILCHCG